MALQKSADFELGEPPLPSVPVSRGGFEPPPRCRLCFMLITPPGVHDYGITPPEVLDYGNPPPRYSIPVGGGGGKERQK